MSHRLKIGENMICGEHYLNCRTWNSFSNLKQSGYPLVSGDHLYWSARTTLLVVPEPRDLFGPITISHQYFSASKRPHRTTRWIQYIRRWVCERIAMIAFEIRGVGCHVCVSVSLCSIVLWRPISDSHMIFRPFSIIMWFDSWETISKTTHESLEMANFGNSIEVILWMCVKIQVALHYLLLFHHRTMNSTNKLEKEALPLFIGEFVKSMACQWPLRWYFE